MGSNLCTLRVDRDGVAAMHRAYAVAMAWPSPSPPTGWKKQSEERREKNANGRQLNSQHCYKIPERRVDAEKSRTQEDTRDERKEKREERDEGRAQKEARREDNHNQHERADEGNSSVPQW